MAQVGCAFTEGANSHKRSGPELHNFFSRLESRLIKTAA